MTLVDSHCHLDYLARDGDLDEVVARARRAGIGTMVTICTKLSQFRQIVGIAERFDDVFCSIGVHPHEADEEGVDVPAAIVEGATHPKVVGIGETGLDYFYEHSARDKQQTSFRAHIAAARETGLPLIVHTRDADADTVRILREEHGKGRYSGLIHCFSSSAELAEAALDLGLYISISGIVTFKKADALRETVRNVPLDRLLVETDSPYLAPMPHRGKRNEPAYVRHVADCVADLKGLSPEALAAQTTENFRRLFTKAVA